MGADARYHPDYEGIVDLTDSGVSVDWADSRALVEFPCREHRTSRSRWAAVVGTSLATACVLLYKQASASRHTLEMFSIWDAARNFLKIDLASDHRLPCCLA